jgi:transcriptional regulator with XRE-family HTH domain
MEEGDIIRNIRKALGMDQESFGKLFGMGPSWTTKLERGRNEGYKQFVEIATKLIYELKVSPDYLLKGNGPIFLEDSTTRTSSPSGILERLDSLEKAVFGTNVSSLEEKKDEIS